MAKLLLPAIIFVLMTLTACSDQATDGRCDDGARTTARGDAGRRNGH